MKYFTSLMMSLAFTASAFAATDVQIAQAAEAEAQQVAVAEEPVELLFHEYATKWKQYAKTGDWYCALKAPEAYTIYLDLYTEELAGEFTVANLDVEESRSLKYLPNGSIEYFTFVDGTIKISQGVDGFVFVDATLSTSLDETLHIVVVPESNEPKKIEVVVEDSFVSSADYYSEDKDWFVSFSDASYIVYLDLINPKDPGSFAGVYKKEDTVDQYTYVMKISDGKKYYFDQLEVVTEGEEPLEYCTISGRGTLDNGDYVHFAVGDVWYEIPESIESVTLNAASNGKVMEQGRLIIRREGVQFNALGQRVK